MTDQLGVVVVGLGLAGSLMVEVIRHHEATTLVAAVDTDADLRARFEAAEGLPALSRLEEALDVSGTDVVYVASPHACHTEQAVKAAAAGRHVVVEKPMALSVADCDAMIEAAERNDVVLIAGHTHGFDPAVGRLAALVRDEVYGVVGHVAMWSYTNFLYRPRSPADLDPKLGGGVVLNQVAHQVDVARTILNRDVLEVRAITTRLDPDRPVDGSCTALLQFGGGLPVSMVYSGYDHFDTDEYQDWVTESGSRGGPRHGAARARLGELRHPEGLERSLALGFGAAARTPPTGQPHFGEVLVSCARADLRITGTGLHIYSDQGLLVEEISSPHPWPGHGAVLDELVAAVQHRVCPLHDGRFGRETVRTCEALLRSAACGQPESLSHEGASP